MTPLIDTIRQKATEAIGSLSAPAEASAPVEETRLTTPYVGWSTDAEGRPTRFARSGPHALVLAGSGIGKTVTLLCPGILLWDGPVLAVSAKSDVAEMTAAHRIQDGPVYMMDLTGQADWDALPEGVIPVANDPTALLVPDETGSTDDSAMDIAELLTQLGTVGMGGGKGGGGDSAFWATLSLGVLACLLQAGAGYPDPATGEWVDGGGIEWVRRAALHPTADTEADPDVLDLDTPCWDVAANRADLLGSVHAEEIEATQALDEKQRDSIGINLRVALKAWTKRAIRGDGSAVAFTPALLEDPSATLYLVSPSKGTGPSAASSVIESQVTHWMLNSVRRKLPKLALVIDECPQISPLPLLGQWVGLLRGYGVHITVAAQYATQFTARFDETYTNELLGVFPTIVVGMGAMEKQLIEDLAWTIPPTERKVLGEDERSAHYERIETHGSELLPRTENEARVINRRIDSEMVKLISYKDMLAP